MTKFRKTYDTYLKERNFKKERNQEAIIVLGLGIIAIGGYLGYKYMNTLTIKIDRYIFTDKDTIGKLYVNDTYLCDTLEDTVRTLNSKEDKIAGQTAIPAGSYQTIITYSPKFKKDLPLLVNVPFFEGIRIHTGSSDKDTEGCILTGKYVNGKFYAENSTVTTIIELMKKYKYTKTVINNLK